MAITRITQQTLTIAAPDSGDIQNPYGADAFIRVSREDGQDVAGATTDIVLSTAPTAGPPARAAIPIKGLKNDLEPTALPQIFRVSGVVDPADDPVLVTILHRFSTPVAEDL